MPYESTDPVDLGKPAPGSGHYIDLEIDGQACHENGDDRGIRLLRPASTVRGQFSLQFSIDEKALGGYTGADLILFPYTVGTSGPIDYSQFYELASAAKFVPGMAYQLCSEGAKVSHVTGSGETNVESLPAGKYRLELKVKGQRAEDQVYVDVIVGS